MCFAHLADIYHRQEDDSRLIRESTRFKFLMNIITIILPLDIMFRRKKFVIINGISVYRRIKMSKIILISTFFFFYGAYISTKGECLEIIMCKKDLKYNALIKNIVACPADSHTPKDIETVYRLVKSETLTEKDFQPPAILDPARAIVCADKRKCSMYALSLFDSTTNIKNNFNKLKKRHQNIEKSIGGIIAKGPITQEDGLSSQFTSKGHMDLHEFEGIKLHSIFVIEGNV